ncbi:MAG TPA: DUF5808 domain-containing protein [Dictyobacter sp.]|jgi:hypothetical protein|nr:DUF5808 domain-containing protein [Dictyobacter sp.]
MKRKPINTLVIITMAVLVGVAIRDQLKLPASERTWHGQIGNIPYDFRFPTLQRIRERVWNKETSSLFMPHIFGVGWTINFYPLLHPNTQSKEA